MSTSMVSTVLEIEREAGTVLTDAGRKAEALVNEARGKSEDAAREILSKAKRDIAALEAAASAEREVKVKELTAAGDAALAAVKNISGAAFDGGVRLVMQALSGK